MKVVGRLMRLSLAPSAVADVAAGVVFGAGFWPATLAPWLLIAASLCVYHGGLVLNDWADREHDRRTRPDRPIPSGAVPPHAAALLGFGLLAAGPWIALGADPHVAAIVGSVALLAATYDLGGRGPWLGPLLLALCRGGNLLAGIWLGMRAAAPLAELPGDNGAALFAVPALYGGYVFAVSRLGRMEDAEDDAPLGRRPARLLAVAAALLLSLPILPVPDVAWDQRALSVTLATGIAGFGAFGLLRLAFRRWTWTRPRVMGAMGMALRRLLIFASATAMMRGGAAGVSVSLLILGGYPLSYALRRVFPPS